MDMILIRGLPGSGKTTFAKRLMKIDSAHFEADMYFIDADGKYIFDVNKLGAAHAWCQSETDNALYYKQNVIVSNTFTTAKELKPYFEIAKKYGIIPIVLTCHNNFGSVHNVPEETLEKMKARFTGDISHLFKE